MERNAVSQPIVALEDVQLTLTSRAGPVEILRDVDLRVDAGQSLAVVGPSGSGKTSLLMVIAGLERATAGRVEVAGHDLTRLGEDELALVRGAAIGIVFQSFHLVPTMTALENVALPLEFAGAPRRLRNGARASGRGRAGHARRPFPGAAFGRRAAARRHRARLSRAPKLILADEPTGNLDGKTGRQVVDLLFGLQRRREATLVLVTHDERLAAACERTIRMADGRIEQAAEALAA